MADGSRARWQRGDAVDSAASSVPIGRPSVEPRLLVDVAGRAEPARIVAVRVDDAPQLVSALVTIGLDDLDGDLRDRAEALRTAARTPPETREQAGGWLRRALRWLLVPGAVMRQHGASLSSTARDWIGTDPRSIVAMLMLAAMPAWFVHLDDGARPLPLDVRGLGIAVSALVLALETLAIAHAARQQTVRRGPRALARRGTRARGTVFGPVAMGVAGLTSVAAVVAAGALAAVATLEGAHGGLLVAAFPVLALAAALAALAIVASVRPYADDEAGAGHAADERLFELASASARSLAALDDERVAALAATVARAIDGLEARGLVDAAVARSARDLDVRRTRLDAALALRLALAESADVVIDRPVPLRSVVAALSHGSGDGIARGIALGVLADDPEGARWSPWLMVDEVAASRVPVRGDGPVETLASRLWPAGLASATLLLVGAVLALALWLPESARFRTPIAPVTATATIVAALGVVALLDAVERVRRVRSRLVAWAWALTAGAAGGAAIVVGGAARWSILHRQAYEPWAFALGLVALVAVVGTGIRVAERLAGQRTSPVRLRWREWPLTPHRVAAIDEHRHALRAALRVREGAALDRADEVVARGLAIAVAMGTLPAAVLPPASARRTDSPGGATT